MQHIFGSTKNRLAVARLCYVLRAGVILVARLRCLLVKLASPTCDPQTPRPDGEPFLRHALA